MAREKIEPSINHHANGATVSCIYRGTLYKRMYSTMDYAHQEMLRDFRKYVRDEDKKLRGDKTKKYKVMQVVRVEYLQPYIHTIEAPAGLSEKEVLALLTNPDAKVKTREYGKPNLVAPADDQASVVVTDTKSEDEAIEEAFDEMNNVFGH